MTYSSFLASGPFLFRHFLRQVVSLLEASQNRSVLFGQVLNHLIKNCEWDVFLRRVRILFFVRSFHCSPRKKRLFGYKSIVEPELNRIQARLWKETILQPKWQPVGLEGVVVKFVSPSLALENKRFLFHMNDPQAKLTSASDLR
jgi:hypothetical protein